MAATQTAFAVLDRHFLDIRCEILNLAAALDRLERAKGYAAVSSDPRLMKLRQGLDILTTTGTDRAERVQLLFSDEYQAGWNR
jgi:hypothetical protein